MSSGVDDLDRSDTAIDTKCSLYYFNAEKGFWEPAVERFSVAVQLAKVGKLSTQVVSLPDPVRINISVRLGGVMHDCLKLMGKS